MSEPRGAIQLEPLLQALFVVAIFAVALVYAVRWGRAHARAEMEFARTQGWTHTFAHNDRQGLPKRLADSLERVAPEKKFDLQSIMTVESGWRKVFLFRCRYRRMYRMGEWERKDNPGSACLIESNRFKSVGSHVEIRWIRGAASAKEIVNESLQEVLLEYKKAPLAESAEDVVITIGRGGAVVSMWGPASPEQWLQLLDLCRQIESAL
ncbi:MAG: hypothetical protein FJX73_08610 [Armatimonadetes bacterium]|nr:hypothetical protein [Armatimonadota bacterium]